MEFSPYLPQIILNDRPNLTSFEQLVVEKHHKLLMKPEMGGYDDNIVYLHRPTKEDLENNQWRVFTAPFSWSQAIFVDELASLGDRVDVLAAAGLVFNELGQVLLAQRAHTMRVLPGVWSWSCAGGIDDIEWDNPKLSAVRELEEEIGIDMSQVKEAKLIGIGLVNHASVRQHWLISSIFIDNTDDFTLSPEEVQAVKWVNYPSQVSPLGPTVEDWWEDIVNLI